MFSKNFPHGTSQHKRYTAVPYFCINPQCENRENPEGETNCRNCGTLLTVKDRFRLIRRLSRPDRLVSTDVFLAEDLEKPEEPKVLKIYYGKDPMRIALIEREHWTLMHLHLPNAPWGLVDNGWFDIQVKGTRLHCVAMTYIKGTNLREWVEENRLESEEKAIAWIQQIVEVLQKLHNTGIFHRDIKPDNIILKPNGTLALIDFGAVRYLSETYYLRLSNGPDVSGRASREITGIFSSGYSPTEQIYGKAMPQSDFFAVGRTMVHLLTGQHPGSLGCDLETGQIEWRHLAPQISKPLLDYLDYMMAVAPGKRPINTSEILGHLEQLPEQIKLFREQALGESIGGENQLSTSPQKQKTPFRIPRIAIAALAAAGLGTLIFTAAAAYAKFNESQEYYKKGLEQALAGNFSESRENFERSIEIDPNNHIAYQNLAITCEALEDIDCLLGAYQKSIELNPDYWPAYFNRGDYYESIEDYKSALEDYRKAMEISPEAIRAASNISRIEILQGNYTQAVKTSQAALEKTDEPTEQSSLFRNLGWASFESDDWNQAETYLQLSLTLDPQLGSAHCLLAKTLDAQGKQSADSWKSCFKLPSNLPEVERWKSDFLDEKFGVV